MKKLLVFALVLAMAPLANAALVISVDGIADPPDTSITVMPSDTVIIDITETDVRPAEEQGIFVLGILLSSTGVGELDISGATILWPPDDTVTPFVDWLDDGDIAGMLEIMNPFVIVSLTDTVEPQDPITGKLVDNIIFHATGPGDVIIGLFDGDDGMLYDTQVIHIPEPITMVLLGLGGLMLRRRK